MTTYNLIGLANEYYTLWTVSKDRKTDSYGRTYTEMNFTYLKNISKDLDKVKSLYPNLDIDTTLRGRHIFNKKVYDKLPDDSFNFGKYRGQKFSEVEDNDYMVWYFGSESNESRKSALGIVLESRGYVLNGYTYISPEEYAKKMEEIEKSNEMFYSIIDGNTNEIYPTRNLDEYGMVEVDGITYKFPEIKENYYNGFYYYLPVLNGKAKRIKNKKIILKKIEVIDEETKQIEVLDFEIAK